MKFYFPVAFLPAQSIFQFGALRLWWVCLDMRTFGRGWISSPEDRCSLWRNVIENPPGDVSQLQVLCLQWKLCIYCLDDGMMSSDGTEDANGNWYLPHCSCGPHTCYPCQSFASVSSSSGSTILYPLVAVVIMAIPELVSSLPFHLPSGVLQGRAQSQLINISVFQHEIPF